MSRTNFAHIPPESEISGVVHAIVEIPKGRRSKYELDERFGVFRLDRYLYASSHYPGDYGFVPQTLAEDGDALDILVMVNEPTFTGCLVEARLVGLFRMRDRGDNDFKLLAVPHRDPLFGEFRDISDVPGHFLREVEHFFKTYKQLEDVVVETEGWAGAHEALQELRASVDRARIH